MFEIRQSRRALGRIGSSSRSVFHGLALSATVALCLIRVAAQAVPTPSLEQELGAEVDRFVEADRVAPPAACQVLFVGSSSIVKWKESLANDMAPLPVINRGFGGSHIEHVNRWFDKMVAPYKPRTIVFYAGENDIDAGKSMERVVADFDEFLRRKTQALGDTPVYFISLKPSKSRFAELSKQSQVNDAIRQRAVQRTDLHYIDIVPAMLDDQGKPKDLFVADGLHMNASGYEIWTKAVRGALLPNTESEARTCHAKADGLVCRASGFGRQALAPDIRHRLCCSTAIVRPFNSASCCVLARS